MSFRGCSCSQVMAISARAQVSRELDAGRDHGAAG